MLIKKVDNFIKSAGLIKNIKSTSQEDTYSCDYINKNGIAVQEEQPTTGEKLWLKTSDINNIFNIPSCGINYGITHSINGSTLNLSGTSSGSGNVIPLTPYFTLEAGTYSISLFNGIAGTKSGFSGSNDMRLYLKYVSDDTNIISMGINGTTISKTTITLSSDTQVYLSMYCNNSGMSFTNYQMGIMAVKGSTQPTTYKKYKQKEIYINNNGTYEKI